MFENLSKPIYEWIGILPQVKFPSRRQNKACTARTTLMSYVLLYVIYRLIASSGGRFRSGCHSSFPLSLAEAHSLTTLLIIVCGANWDVRLEYKESPQGHRYRLWGSFTILLIIVWRQHGTWYWNTKKVLKDISGKLMFPRYARTCYLDWYVNVRIEIPTRCTTHAYVILILNCLGMSFTFMHILFARDTLHHTRLTLGWTTRLNTINIPMLYVPLPPMHNY